MSEVVSALHGRSAEGPVTIRDAGPRGMIQVRGDLGSEALQSVCREVAGSGFPGQGGAEVSETGAVLWMSPDEVLVLTARDKAAEGVARISEALKGTHHLAVDVSDARAILALEGAGLREVLARLTPANMHPEAFRPGQMRRTRLAQVAAGVWMTSETSAELICFRSVADYAFDLLANAAASPAVGHLPTA